MRLGWVAVVLVVVLRGTTIRYQAFPTFYAPRSCAPTCRQPAFKHLPGSDVSSRRANLWYDCLVLEKTMEFFPSRFTKIWLLNRLYRYAMKVYPAFAFRRFGDRKSVV